MADDPSNPVVFDAAHETAAERIRVLNHPDGGVEFIVPALRNFRVKITFTILWVALAGFIGVFAFVFEHDFAPFLPAVLLFVLANHVYYFLGFVLLFELLITFLVLDLWLRSSTIIARPGALQIRARWLLVQRTLIIPIERIIEMRTEDNTSVNNDHYYDVVALTTGDGMGWLASWLSARKPMKNDVPADELKMWQTGGKKVVLATSIKGKDEAMWLLEQIRAAAGIEV